MNKFGVQNMDGQYFVVNNSALRYNHLLERTANNPFNLGGGWLRSSSVGSYSRSLQLFAAAQFSR